MNDDLFNFSFQEESPFLRYILGRSGYHPVYGDAKQHQPEFPTPDENYDAGYQQAVNDIAERFGGKHFDQHGVPLDADLVMWAAQRGLKLSEIPDKKEH